MPQSNSMQVGNLVLPAIAFDEQFIRASGPGGQHVNKTESAVQLRFAAQEYLPPAWYQRLRRLAGRRLSSEGVLVLESSSHRSQVKNRDAARARLQALLEAAAKPPKKRLATRPSLSSVKRQQRKKSERAATKSLRKPPKLND